MRTRTVLGGGAALLASAAMLAACGESDGGGSSGGTSAGTSTSPSTSTSMSMSMPASSAASSSAPAAAGATTITITNFSYGAPITVKPGATVTVINKDTAPHNVNSDDGTSFKQTPVASATYTFTAPMTPGVYPFHCSVHPNMHGTLTVAA